MTSDGPPEGPSSPDPAPGEPLDPVDPMSEVEAEAAAQTGIDHDLSLATQRRRPDPAPPAGRPAVAPDTIGTAPPPNRRVGRQRFLVAYLRIALVLAFVVGVLELVLPIDLRDEAGIVMVVVFVAAPVGRIVWLVIRWLRLGDWRFALVGGLLLGVVATGFLVR